MYHFFVEEEQIEEKLIRITGSDVNHIRNVLRMKPKEELLISSRQGGDYHCAVETVGEDEVCVRILWKESLGRELSCEVILFQGLPKGDKMELVIQKNVELGVTAIVPVAMKRCVVKLDEKKAAAKQKRRQQEDRSRFFQLLAGGYLVYLAWQLISGAIGEKDWQTTKLIGVIAGVVFAAAGIWLLIRNLRAEAKKSEAVQQPEDPEDKEGEDET